MSEYIQINIGGKPRGIKFTMWAMEKMDKLQRSLPEPSLLDTTAAMVYSGLANNCRHAKREPDFTFDDVLLWVDELLDSEEGRATIQKVNDALAESNTYKYLIEEAKKKQLSESSGTMSTDTPLESLALDQMSTTT